MVKDDHHRTRAIAVDGGEIAINSKRTAFTLISSIQEEVHRWAIGYHRQQRKASSISTTLTRIDGVGEAGPGRCCGISARSRRCRAATVDELCLVKGVSRPAAENIKRYFETRED